MRQWIAALGAGGQRRLTAAGETTHLALLSGLAAVTLTRSAARVVARVAALQVRFTGLHAVALTTTIGFLAGTTVVLQAVHPFPALGAEAWVAELLVLIVVRELGPLIAAVIVIGRSGTAMAAELATMRLRGEVSELEVQGIDSVQYLFLPRLLAAVVSCFALIVYFDVAALAGGYGFLLLDGSAPSLPSFLGSFVRALDDSDVVLLPVKAIVYGGFVALVACHRGLTIAPSPTEVPRAATRAVVTSLLGVFLIDAALAALVYL